MSNVSKLTRAARLGAAEMLRPDDLDAKVSATVTEPTAKEEVKSAIGIAVENHRSQLIPWKALFAATIGGVLVNNDHNPATVLLVAILAATGYIYTKWRMTRTDINQGRIEPGQQTGRRVARIARHARRARNCGAAIGVWLVLVSFTDAARPDGLIVWLAGGLLWAIVAHEGWWAPAEQAARRRTFTTASTIDDHDDLTVAVTTSPVPAGPPPVPRVLRNSPASASAGVPAQPAPQPVLPAMGLLNRQAAPVRMPDDLTSVLQAKLDGLNVDAKVIGSPKRGPRTSLYSMEPGPTTSISKLMRMQRDFDFVAKGACILHAPIPGVSMFGVEVPNPDVEKVLLGQLLASVEARNNKAALLVGYGRDIEGNNILIDLAKLPHVLIAGATGAGKSVFVNDILVSILTRMTPKNVRLLLIDPKRVELTPYDGVPHLLTPVITDAKKAVHGLEWLILEMDRRYTLFEHFGVRHIDQYNDRLQEIKEGKVKPPAGIRAEDLKPLARILALVDELADLMMVAQQDVEKHIVRLTQLARASGIHLVLATQRPSVDVVTGLIKANVPARIAFAVTSGTDSKVILDKVGAERLLGSGDSYYSPQNSTELVRVQAAWVEEKEIEAVVTHWRNQPTDGTAVAMIDLQATVDDDQDDAQDAAAPRTAREELLATGERLADADGLVTKQQLAAATPDMNEKTRDAALGQLTKNEWTAVSSAEGGGRGVYRVRPPAEDGFNMDDLIQAIELVVTSQFGSTAMLQRKMRLGFAKACRLMDLMEENGIVGPAEGSRARDVLIKPDQLEEVLAKIRQQG